MSRDVRSAGYKRLEWIRPPAGDVFQPKLVDVFIGHTPYFEAPRSEDPNLLFAQLLSTILQH